ncbi:MAG: DUF2029 domain-containing protein [Planctomycetia bacterium]|nr:DUF2029 domain-containing protein [Planctomycetia bacterium]
MKSLGSAKVLLALLFAATAFHAVRRIYTLKTDFDGFWRAGRAVLEGRDPYEPGPGPKDDRLVFPSIRAAAEARHGPPSSRVPDPVADEADGEGSHTQESAVLRYLPFFGIFMAPFALLPMDLAALAWHALSFAALLVGIRSAFRLSGRDRPLASGDTVAVLLVTAVFWADTFTMGQVGLVTLGLSLAAADAARNRPWLGGALAGLAAAIKVTPAIVAVWFVLKRRWAAAAASAAAFLLCCALTVPVWGADRARDLHAAWLEQGAATAGRKFFEHGSSFRYQNQSLHAWAARVFMDVNAGRSRKPFRINVADLSPSAVAWIVRLAQVPLLALAAFALLARKNREPLTLSEAGLVCTLTTFVAPVCWTFHLVVLIPAVACLLDRRAEPEFRRWLLAVVLLEFGMAHPVTRALGLPMLACLAAFLGCWRSVVRERAGFPAVPPGSAAAA